MRRERSGIKLVFLCIADIEACNCKINDAVLVIQAFLPRQIQAGKSTFDPSKWTLHAGSQAPLDLVVSLLGLGENVDIRARPGSFVLGRETVWGIPLDPFHAVSQGLVVLVSNHHHFVKVLLNPISQNLDQHSIVNLG